VREFVQLVLTCCPKLKQIFGKGTRGRIKSNSILYFGKKGVLKSSYLAPPHKRSNVKMSIENAHHRRELFKEGKWDSELIVTVYDEQFAECSKKVAHEYEWISRGKVTVVLKY
jgi:hypothetical protein